MFQKCQKISKSDLKIYKDEKTVKRTFSLKPKLYKTKNSPEKNTKFYILSKHCCHPIPKVKYCLNTFFKITRAPSVPGSKNKYIFYLTTKNYFIKLAT